jgi:hypothetical protein
MHRYADPRPWWLLVLVCVLTHGAAVFAAAPPVVLDEHVAARTALNGHIELLFDVDARYRPADVVHGQADAAFRAPSGTTNNLGFTRADVWARFRVESRSEARHVLVLPRPLLDFVTLYRVADDGAVTHVATGDARPFALRPVAYRGFAFPLARQSATYYLRVHSPTSAIGLPLSIVEADSFNRFVSTENYLLAGR